MARSGTGTRVRPEPPPSGSARCRVAAHNLGDNRFEEDEVRSAVVFGGGGPVGIAWEAGLVEGLAAHGVPLRRADTVIGTSAGSVVGATLTLGGDPGELVPLLGTTPASPPDGARDLLTVQTAIAQATAGAAGPEAALAAIGRIALEARTVDEGTFTGSGVFALLGSSPWPEAFRCTAIDTATGRRHVWDRSHGVDLGRAVAASCAVPTVFPPVTIGGGRFMDGGMTTPLNADAAAGHDVVLVVSCFPLHLPEAVRDQPFGASARRQLADIEALRRGGAEVLVVEPDEEFLTLSGWGAHVMDHTRAAEAHRLGLRRGALEADRLAALRG